MRSDHVTRRRFVHTGLTALIAGGVAGCSGDGGGETTPTGTSAQASPRTDTATSRTSRTSTPPDTATSTPPATPTSTSPATTTPTPSFALDNHPGEHVDVVGPGGPVARYMYAYDEERRHETYKTYLHVIDPATGGLLTSGPTGQFPHHRGIFIGWDELTVDGTVHDFWHFDGGERMVHDGFEGVQSFPSTATLTSVTHWITPAETVIEESRAMTFGEPPSEVDDGIVVIDLASTLTARDSDVELLGDPEHAGIQYRPHNDVNANGSAKYVFPENAFSKSDPSNDRINGKEGLRWVGQTHTIRDRDYFVQHMNHPDNPPDTVYSAYRPYGRFGAFFEATIPAGESLTVRYRFLIKRGDALPVGTLESLYEEYTVGRKH